MRTVKLYLPLTLLVLSSLVLAIKTVQVFKDKEIILSQIKVKDTTEPLAGEPLTDSELITARQMIEGYAALYSLPVEVKLEKRDIRVIVVAQEQEEGESAIRDDESKFAVLQNFDNIMEFFNSLSTMPYALDYKEFCVGVDCPSVFDLTIVARSQQIEDQQVLQPEPPQTKRATDGSPLEQQAPSS